MVAAANRKNKTKTTPKATEEDEANDTFFTDDDDEAESVADSAASDTFFTDDDEAGVKRVSAAAVIDDRFRGGLLGLLVLGRDLADDEVVDGRTARQLRMAQETFVSAVTPAPAPRRLPPVLSIACVDAAKSVYSDPRDLRVAGGSACGRDAYIVQSLPDHLLRLQEAKHKYGRMAEDVAIRRQIWEIDARYGESSKEAYVASDPVGAEAITTCVLDGWLAESKSNRAPPVALFRRFLGPSALYDGDRVVVRPVRRALVDRASWVRALRSATLPPFREAESFDASLGGFVVGGEGLVAPTLAETSGGACSLRVALMRGGVAEDPPGAEVAALIRGVQEATAAIASETASANENENEDALSLETALEPIDEMSEFASSSDAERERRGAPRPKEGGGAVADSDTVSEGCEADLPELPGQLDRTVADVLQLVGSDPKVTAVQGHLLTAGPVFELEPTATPRVHVYGHVRSIDPGSACMTLASARIREAGERLREEVDAAIAASAARRAEDRGVFPDVRAGLRAFSVAYERIRRPVRERLGASATTEAARIVAELASVEPRDEIDYDGLLALGISDAAFYARSAPVASAPGGAGGKDRPEDFLAVRGAGRLFHPRDLLAELASSLGLSPPLGVTEERAVLDGFEYHMPSGEGESARQLRRRIAEIRRRRAELMAKVDRSGKQYDAVERKLMDRLRTEAAPKMVAEAICGLCAVLSEVVLVEDPERVASAPSGALSACLAAMARRRAKAKAKAKAAEVDLLDLLACAAAGLLSGRLPPPTPTEVDLRAQIEAAIDEVRADLPEKKLRVAAAIPRNPSGVPADFRPARSQPAPGSRSAPSGRLMSASSRLISELWTHVRSVGSSKLRVKDDVFAVRSSDACCSFVVADAFNDDDASKNNNNNNKRNKQKQDVERSRWQALGEDSAAIRSAFEAIDRTRGSEDASERDVVLAGTPVALSLTVERDGPSASASASVVIVHENAVPVDPPAVAAPTIDAAAEDLDAAFRELRASVPRLGASLADLAAESGRRFEALRKLDDGVSASNDLRDLLIGEDGEDGPRIAHGFVRAELASSLTRLGSSARMTAALAADRELAQISAAVASRGPSSSTAWREKCQELATACAAASRAPEALAPHVAIWACLELASCDDDAGPRAAIVLLSRLGDRAAFNRRDREEEEDVELQQKMEDARARVKSSLDDLSDEQREILRERRKIGLVDDVRAAVGEGEGRAATAEDAAEDAAEANGDRVVDAIDMYA